MHWRGTRARSRLKRMKRVLTVQLPQRFIIFCTCRVKFVSPNLSAHSSTIGDKSFCKRTRYHSRKTSSRRSLLLFGHT